MDGYQRPDIGPVVILDEAGNEIPYGQRWEGIPPDESYSVVSHPERFAPLHDVADALVDHLIGHFDVTADHDPPLNSLHHGPEVDVVRAVRLTPSDPGAAPLTFIHTQLPGIHLHAGAVTSWSFPSCGCDACDEVWDEVADELEETVRAVVTGGFAERLRRQGLSWWMEHSTSSRDRDSWASQRVSRGEVKELRGRMSEVPDNWHAWPRR